MITVRVEVLGEAGCLTVAVYAENLRRAVRIAKDRYPGSTVRIAFPIEPENFFAAEPRRGRTDFEAAEEAG
jgi:hypothetical protein